jgi:hypothetical protein
MEDSEKQILTMGLACLIPGMQRMLDLMQGELDKLKGHLSQLQTEPQKRGRPPGKHQPLVSTNHNSGWPSDPEERSREMKRRIGVRLQKKATLAAPTHPRDPRHPNHESWLRKLKRLQRRNWEALSPKQKRDRLAAMQAGRAAARPNGELRSAVQ